MFANKVLGSLVHGIMIQWCFHCPGTLAFQSQRRAAVDDTIKVVAFNRIKTRIKFGCHSITAQHSYRIGF